MIVTRVIRDEGTASALLRAGERIRESVESACFFSAKSAPIVNVAPGGTGARTGGVAVQLRARLRVERLHRPVLLRPRASGLGPEARIHFEGTGAASKSPYIVSVHDLTLLHRQEFLSGAAALIFSSSHLRDRYQLPGEIIEPGISVAPAILPAKGQAIAFAGAVQPHKGGHLLPDIANELQKRGKTLHVFGRGDGDFLRALRPIENVNVHGYYQAGTLTALLQHYGIGLVLVPSVVPESFCLTISEAWAAGAAVAAFDLGAQGERIRQYGGGWVTPLDSGAGGIVQLIDRWSSEPVVIPPNIPTAEEAARAYLDLYRRLGWLA